MAKVLCNLYRNMVLEVARGEKTVAFIRQDGGEINIGRMEKAAFDREYCLDPPMGTNGREATPRRYARHYLSLTYLPIADDAASLLVDLMALTKDEARSDKTAILTNQSGQLLGSYESGEDANLVTRLVGGDVILSAKQMKNWSKSKLDMLKQQVAPKLKIKSQSKLTGDIFNMAKKAEKQATPEVTKTAATKKERTPRTDGPVAKVKAYIEANAAKFKSGALTKVQAVDELKALGINKGTIGVQLPKQLKELGIEAQKGSRAKPKEAKAASDNGDEKKKPKAKAAAAKPSKAAKAVKKGKGKSSHEARA